MSEGKAWNCPKCGKQMEKGHIITPAVRWSKERHTQWAFGQEPIIPWQIQAIPNVEAYRCSGCRILLFHYPIPRAEETPESFLKKCVKCSNEIPVASETCPICGQKQTRSSQKKKEQAIDPELL